MDKDKIFYVEPGRFKIRTHKSIVRRGAAYEATASQAETNEEAADTRSLLEKFAKLDEGDLYAMAHDDQPVGPRISVDSVPGPTLKALANYALEVRARKRDNWKWLIGIGVTAAIAVAGWLFAAFDLLAPGK